MNNKPYNINQELKKLLLIKHKYFNNLTNYNLNSNKNVLNLEKLILNLINIKTKHIILKISFKNQMDK